MVEIYCGKKPLCTAIEGKQLQGLQRTIFNHRSKVVALREANEKENESI